MMAGPKIRHTIFLSPATAAALEEYTARHRDRGTTLSQAADELLHRALTVELGAATEGLLAPTIRQVVRETVRQELADVVRGATREQSDRLATLLAKAAIQAGAARHLAHAVLHQVLIYDHESEQDIREAKEEADDKDRAAYTRAVAELKMRSTTP